MLNTECVFCGRILEPHEVDFGFCEAVDLCSANARVEALKRKVIVMARTITVARMTIKMGRDANSVQE